MKDKIVIIANGPMKNRDLQLDIIKNSDILICADGGANLAKKLELIPNYIIGDLDSIKKSVYRYYKDLGKTEIIEDTNQDKTDLELAISLAETLNPSELKIFGAVGDRIDHTLANIYCLDKINPEIKSTIFNGKTTIELIKQDKDIIGNKKDILSVIPISDVHNLNYDGLKWNVKNLNTKSGWFGLSNKFEKNKANISFSKGKILVIRIRDNDN